MPPKIIVGACYVLKHKPGVSVRVLHIGEFRMSAGFKSVAIVYQDSRDGSIHVRRSSEFREFFDRKESAQSHE